MKFTLFQIIDWSHSTLLWNKLRISIACFEPTMQQSTTSLAWMTCLSCLNDLVELDKRNPFTDKPSKGKNGVYITVEECKSHVTTTNLIQKLL